MNNKEIAEDISSIFWDTSLSRDELIKIITSALDKAAGKVDPEFEFGQHVIVDDLCGGLKSAVYGYKTQDGYHGVLQVGEVDTCLVERCTPDPAYAKILFFIKHDYRLPYSGKGCDKIWAFDFAGCSTRAAANMIQWETVNIYAIIPEGFLS